jgi:hypothetical protein
LNNVDLILQAVHVQLVLTVSIIINKRITKGIYIIYSYIYIYIQNVCLKIKPNSVRIRSFFELTFFCLQSKGFKNIKWRKATGPNSIYHLIYKHLKQTNSHMPAVLSASSNIVLDPQDSSPIQERWLTLSCHAPGLRTHSTYHHSGPFCHYAILINPQHIFHKRRSY